MIELSLPREAVGLLGAHIEAHFSIPALRAGLDLYKDKKVTHTWKDQFNIIHAIVGKPGDDDKLQLDLDFFLASECQCGERLCPHMAAVFFALYAPHENPEQWLADVAQTKTAVAPVAADGAQTVMAPAVKPADRPETDVDTAGLAGTHHAIRPGEWGEALGKQLDALYRRQTDRFRIDIFYYTAYKKLGAIAEQLHEEEKPYFRIYCAIALMLHAERHFAAHATDYPLPYYHKLAADLNDHFMARLRDAAAFLRPASASDGQRESACAEAIRDLLTERLPVPEPAAFHWIDLHRYAWELLLGKPEWLEAENRRLSELALAMAGQGAETSERAGTVAMMAAHLDWLLGRDEAAMRRLANPNLAAGALIVSYLETHHKTASWTRLGNWLAFALPRIRRCPADAFNRALAIWRDYAGKTGDGESYKQALTALLPRSYPQYTEYLIKSEQYEEWAYFHLLSGIPPGKADRAELKQLELYNAALAFPLYHHAIARQLVARNRSAYRETVKLLKHLKEVYAAAGEPQRFQMFVRELADRHVRLHAFMEELEKGKLLE